MNTKNWPLCLQLTARWVDIHAKKKEIFKKGWDSMSLNLTDVLGGVCSFFAFTYHYFIRIWYKLIDKLKWEVYISIPYHRKVFSGAILWWSLKRKFQWNCEFSQMSDDMWSYWGEVIVVFWTLVQRDERLRNL